MEEGEDDREGGVALGGEGCVLGACSPIMMSPARSEMGDEPLFCYSPASLLNPTFSIRTPTPSPSPSKLTPFP